MQAPDPKRPRSLGSLAREPQLGTSIFQTDDLDLVIGYAVRPPRSKGFDTCFLRGEPGGKRLRVIRARNTRFTLSQRENDCFELSVSGGQRLCDSLGGNHIQPDAEDHLGMGPLTRRESPRDKIPRPAPLHPSPLSLRKSGFRPLRAQPIQEFPHGHEHARSLA
jgi:hypothetical protein